jgi:hypothetical protein
MTTIRLINSIISSAQDDEMRNYREIWLVIVLGTDLVRAFLIYFIEIVKLWNFTAVSFFLNMTWIICFLPLPSDSFATAIRNVYHKLSMMQVANQLQLLFVNVLRCIESAIRWIDLICIKKKKYHHDSSIAASKKALTHKISVSNKVANDDDGAIYIIQLWNRVASATITIWNFIIIQRDTDKVNFFTLLKSKLNQRDLWLCSSSYGVTGAISLLRCLSRSLV